MNDQWTDFEKFVFKELGEIKEQISILRGKSMVWGAIAGVIAAAILEAFLKAKI